jgi:hypothetical protein
MENYKNISSSGSIAATYMIGAIQPFIGIYRKINNGQLIHQYIRKLQYHYRWNSRQQFKPQVEGKTLFVLPH